MFGFLTGRHRAASHAPRRRFNWEGMSHRDYNRYYVPSLSRPDMEVFIYCN